MTLVTGIVCRYKDEKCVLLTGDKALSCGTRVLESPKIKQIKDYKIVIGEAGDLSDLQRFYLCFAEYLDGFFTEEREKYKSRIAGVMDVMLVQREFLRGLNEEEIDGEVLIGATDIRTTKLYHIYAGGKKAIEIPDFVCIGSGAGLVGTLVLKSIYSPKSPLTLDEAVRCAAVVNILASRLTSGVSANFDSTALCKEKIGGLTEISKGQLIRDANFIAHKWLNLMRNIFFMPLESTLGFIEESNIGKLIKEFTQKDKKGKDTVLIIDDAYSKQQDISGNIEKILKDKRLNSIVFTSRVEFKKEYKNVRDKLRFVILDRRIEHRVTTDLLRVINESERAIPVVLMSRGLKESDIETFLERGISFHISKEEIANEPQKVQELISGVLKEGDYLWEWV